METLQLNLVGSHSIEDNWSAVGPWIIQAMGEGADAWDVNYIKQQATIGNAQIFVLSRYEIIEAVLVTESAFYGGRKTLVLRWFSGRLEDSWLKWIFMLEDYALKSGYERLEVWGRKGWERKLRDYGFGHEFAVLGKHITKRAH